MHISEGILNAPVLISGVAATALGVSIGLKKMDYEVMPKVAVLAAAFFVASLIHVPIGPSSVHLVLNGLVGLLLGWTAFPAILVALALQVILFQFGGFTTLGINTLNMALPAVGCFYLFRRATMSRHTTGSVIAGFTCGFLSIALSCFMLALSLAWSEQAFIAPAKLILLAHFPIMIIEGLITAFCILFLKKVKPDLLEI